MNLWSIIAISAGLALLALISFMLVAFSAGAVVNTHRPGRFQLAILNVALYLLPAISAIAIVLMWYAFLLDHSGSYFWWSLLPLPFLLLYLIFVTGFHKRWW